MMNIAPETQGILRLPLKEYGRSALGSVLNYIPCHGICKILVVAGIHGEESETTFLLSRALRLLEKNLQDVAFVLCANPDGMTLGTRGNANGVDLNRNFPTANWTPTSVASRSILEAPRDTLLSPGASSGSEPETRALLTLIEQLRPESIISMHAPIACVDAPVKTPLVTALCECFNLSWRPDIGYPTPGSLGTWCKERSLECVTLELPRMSLEALFEHFGKSFAELLAQL